MRIRILALAAVSALQYTMPWSAGAVSAPVNACTSLVPVCVGGCNRGDVIHVNVIGHGYGDAKCGGATSWCDTQSQLDTCNASVMTLNGGSTFACRVDGYSGLPFAICTSEPPVD